MISTRQRQIVVIDCELLSFADALGVHANLHRQAPFPCFCVEQYTSRGQRLSLRLHAFQSFQTAVATHESTECLVVDRRITKAVSAQGCDQFVEIVALRILFPLTSLAQSNIDDRLSQARKWEKNPK